MFFSFLQGSKPTLLIKVIDERMYVLGEDNFVFR